MRSLLDFMYKGEVNVGQSSLPMFLKTAESLQVCTQVNLLPEFNSSNLLLSLSLRCAASQTTTI